MNKNQYKKLAFAVALTAVVGLIASALAVANKKGLVFLSSASAAGPAAKVKARPGSIHTERTYNISLSRAQVSPTDNNQIIIVMNATGDLPGALTLKLTRDGSASTVTGGEWALVVAYTELLTTEASDDGHPGESLIQKGTLKGTLSGGNITLNADGSIASVDSLQMIVNGGTLTYETVTDGNGSVQASSLQDVRVSNGNLAISF